MCTKRGNVSATKSLVRTTLHKNLTTIIILLVPPLTLANIISTHHAYSQSECAFNCLIEEECVGFKYKPCTKRESGNCQLSNTTGDQNNLNIEDKGWMFFIDVKNKPVSKLTNNISDPLLFYASVRELLTLGVHKVS